MISYMSYFALKTGFGVACWSLFGIEGGSTLAGN